MDKNSTGWYMGTGWLITPEIMITAGHNVYNWAGNGLGKATVIKCHIGYQGKESVGKATVQTRHAKRCVTSAEWLASKDNRHRDFAFIQVDKPFTGNLRAFSYGKTPPHGTEMLGVVGYPGDRTIKDSYGRDERGAMMYKEFDKVAYDRTAKTNALGMLTYRISTFGGQSGSPVIREGTQTGIATHVYGLGDKNQASPITDYDNFFSAFKQNLPKAGEVDGIALHKPTGAGAEAGAEGLFGDIINFALPIGKSILGIESTLDSVGKSELHSFGPSTEESTLDNNNSIGSEEESFADIFRKIGSVVSSVGKVVVPTVATALLGPAGAPVAAIAHAALGALGNACESTLDTDPSSAAHKVIEGAPERGVLAESALQTVMKLHKHNPSHPVLRKIHADMAQSYGQVEPAIPHLAEQLKPALIKGAAIVGQTSYIAKNKAPRSTGGQRLPIRSTIVGAESAGGSNAFEECILGDTKVVAGEEAFFENVGNFLSKGFQVAKPILRASAVAGLNAIATRLAASGKQESALDGSDSDHESQAAKLVVQRAVMGESALQALGKLKEHELNSLTVPSESGAQEESFGDFFKSAVQKIGSVVKTVAPVVINNVLPAVIKAVQGSGQESAAEGFGSALPGPRSSALSRKPSRFTLYNGHQESTQNQGFLSVSALLPSHGMMTADHVHEERESAPLHRCDSNEDLPIYHEYD
ncbi:hypothetical protein Daus18300_012806 [Diaporthe australafricana]|uniref:Serine protease n=1 Tax=Diaporthe australafricana TaxID=127596 RepID=A0ABR3W1Q6_9PEZI